MTFTQEQKAELEKKLDPKNVAQRSQGGRQLSYIEGWHAIAEANRIFGFDGWTRETIDLIENTTPTQNNKGNNVVSFRARVRITAGGITREGVGFGSGIARDIHDAYEGAIKEAETDAMKRAFMTFGNPFGLALYDKTQSNVGVDPFTDKEYTSLTKKLLGCDSLECLESVKAELAENKARMNRNQVTTLGESYKRKLEELTPMAAE